VYAKLAHRRDGIASNVCLRCRHSRRRSHHGIDRKAQPVQFLALLRRRGSLERRLETVERLKRLELAETVGTIADD
jgi:hypothetical protein